jgi:hypothetical protein
VADAVALTSAVSMPKMPPKKVSAVSLATTVTLMGIVPVTALNVTSANSARFFTVA